MQPTRLFNRDFLLVVIGQIISLFGNAILRFALPLYLLRETNSPALFGIVTACSFLPMIILSFFGGILADRVNKRNIMVILDFITAGIILVFYFLVGNISIVPLFIVTLMLLYGISGTYQPTVQASIPVLVPSDKILQAGAIVNQISSLSGLLGPVVGGVLFGQFGINPILIISIICFAASAIMEIFIQIPFTKRKEKMGIISIVKSDFLDSMHYIRRDKPLLLKIIILVAFFNLILSSILVIGLPVTVVKTLALGDEMLGLMQGLMGLGGLCGGICTAVFAKKLKFSNLHLVLMVCSICVGFAALPLILNMGKTLSFVIITIAGFVAMAFATIFSVQVVAIVQIETPPKLVGKIIALIISLSVSAQPVGQAIYGVLFDAFSNNTGMIFLGAFAIAVIISLFARRIFVKVAPEISTEDAVS